MTIGRGYPPTAKRTINRRLRHPRRSHMGLRAGHARTRRPADVGFGRTVPDPRPHPVLRDRDLQLDLAGGSLVDVARWKPEVLDVFLCSAPMWCGRPGQTSDRLPCRSGCRVAARTYASPPPRPDPHHRCRRRPLSDRVGWKSPRSTRLHDRSLAAGFTDTLRPDSSSDAQVDIFTKRSRNPDSDSPDQCPKPDP